MDTKLIQDFCLGFYGYGNLRSDYWFIGMEEGGQNTIEEFYENYVENWDGKESTDMLDGVNKEAEDMFFNDKAKIQKTWGGIIKLLLSIENGPTDKESILNFQKTNLGRINGNNLLLELLPLPNRSIENWGYHSLGLPQFDTRENYLKYFLPKRIMQIKELISKYNPKVVVFYSTTKEYLKSWKEIMQIDNNTFIPLPFITKINEIIFVICKHPAAYGLTNEYYPEIGKNVRKLLSA
jgi:hypothetical protein